MPLYNRNKTLLYLAAITLLLNSLRLSFKQQVRIRLVPLPFSSSLDVTPACKKGQFAHQLGTPKTNGCGPTKLVNFIMPHIVPYSDIMNPSCHNHDFCYGTIVRGNHRQAYIDCNLRFRQCMDAVCVKSAEGKHPLKKDAFLHTCKMSAFVYWRFVE